MAPEPFEIHIPERDLSDLRARLDRVRLPEPETVPDATQGLELRRLTALIDEWRRHDWRATEARMNALPHYRAELDGLGIAFWHVRSPEPSALPLLLTHGWPGSVLEFEQLLGPLTDPVAHGGSAEDAFHVVVPALPGFGFSDRPHEPGWHPGRTARAWADLMTSLGYPRFAAHGGDWGAHVSTELARFVPERVVGLHLTMPVASPLPEDRTAPTPDEQRMLDRRDRHLADGYGFGMQMGTRPQTIGYALLDSPAGLAAWLGEKFAAYADSDGVSLAQQLDTIALYWLTGTGASSSRWYWEALRWVPRSAEEENALPVSVPTFCSSFPAEPWPTARRWAERRYRDLRSWHVLDRGGHFPGLEQPAVLVSEIRDAFREIRTTG
ncbi:Pimeloyl-ACP methyl ester carboxylesterase [Amycolatopsis sacchari]|uniref:Pimeloyl-ACP methyl ester carboxylesterase n=1 Tax=Amycolatopsis sacchari TaxID=115433 RepID=A0A1I3RAK8_9PSEU|nr:epoxide hydrolase family protein [Amycolatopsis sacchari]SFJ43358.1 Pimeloyl-ACP methyl ester carboxylesterase [Amycolatopsis sacchari]